MRGNLKIRKKEKKAQKNKLSKTQTKMKLNK